MSVSVRALPSATPETAPTPPPESCTVVIFGATGDLTRRKLMPALFALRCFGALSSRCEVIGVGRTPLSDEEFRARMREAVVEDAAEVVTEDKRQAGDADTRWEEFEQRLHYVTGDPNDAAFYATLATALATARQNGASPNTLFYIATPASLASPSVAGLRAAGLPRNLEGWSRIVLEKPFGHELDMARELNRVVAESFPEETVFRIDHYLGKEEEQELECVERLYPARHYVLIDDKLRILTATKRIRGSRVTTVFPRQGHYVLDADVLARWPASDLDIGQIGDLLDFQLPALLNLAAGSRSTAACGHLSAPTDADVT